MRSKRFFYMVGILFLIILSHHVPWSQANPGSARRRNTMRGKRFVGLTLLMGIMGSVNVYGAETGLFIYPRQGHETCLGVRRTPLCCSCPSIVGFLGGSTSCCACSPTKESKNKDFPGLILDWPKADQTPTDPELCPCANERKNRLRRGCTRSGSMAGGVIEICPL
jgi:hypothetical protein